MKSFYKIRNDIVFKSIFCKEENKELLERLIKEVIGEDVTVISLNVPELIKDKVYVKGKTLDVLVKTKDKEINIEINTLPDLFLRRRNAGYIFKRYSDNVQVGKTYQDMPEFIQINLSVNLPKDYPCISTYILYDHNNNLTFIDNFKIYEINLEKIKELCYNKDIKGNILSMLDMDLEELLNVKGDKYMEKLKKEAIYLNNEDEFAKYMPDDVAERLFMNSYIQKGFEQGIEQGIEQKNIEIAKKMLAKDTDINFISEITGLSIEEINKINDEL